MDMMYYLASTAETTTESNLFASLGIDWKMLVLQAIAFLAVLWLLNKFVYPVLIKMLDERDAKIEEGQRAAAEAVKAAEAANQSTEDVLTRAKKDAEAIVEIAQKEADRIALEAESRAQKKADHILEQAQTRIDSDIADARQDLRDEMVNLVSLASEKIIGQKIDAKTDARLIRRALEETR